MAVVAQALKVAAYQADPDGRLVIRGKGLYDKLWTLTDPNGNHLCEGFTALGNTMTILNKQGRENLNLPIKSKR